MTVVDSHTMMMLTDSLSRVAMYATSMAAHYDRAMNYLSQIQPDDQIEKADAASLDMSLWDVEKAFLYFAEVMDRWHPEDEPETSTEQSPPLLTAFDFIRSSKRHDTASFEPECLPGLSET